MDAVKNKIIIKTIAFQSVLGGMQNTVHILWHRSKKWAHIKACIDEHM